MSLIKEFLIACLVNPDKLKTSFAASDFSGNRGEAGMGVKISLYYHRFGEKYIILGVDSYIVVYFKL